MNEAFKKNDSWKEDHKEDGSIDCESRENLAGLGLGSQVGLGRRSFLIKSGASLFIPS